MTIRVIRAARLATLAQKANLAHHKVMVSWKDAFDAARAAGEALLEAKRLVDRGKWIRWCRRNFDGSDRTARGYMLVAKKWDTDPRILRARKDGFVFTSMISFLKCLRGDPLPRKTPTGIVDARDWLLCMKEEIKREFREKLDSLREEELEVLAENFDEIWRKEWYQELHHITCCQLEFDPWDDGTPAAKKRLKQQEKTGRVVMKVRY
jgi:hypothetical protein